MLNKVVASAHVLYKVAVSAHVLQQTFRSTGQTPQHTHTIHTTPYTLHTTPYTPHPTPYTLHPTPTSVGTDLSINGPDSACFGELPPEPVVEIIHM